MWYNMYFQNNYPCTYIKYFHFERFSTQNVNRYPDMIFVRSTMYLLCDHHSFESNVCQFIWTITMFEIFSITILCDKHAKIVFLYVSSFVQLLLELGFLRQFSTRNILKLYFFSWKKAIHFCITSEKKLVPIHQSHICTLLY